MPLRSASTILARMSASQTPEFRHVSVWIFDLDNTLYSSACGLFGQIDARMTAFVAELMDLSQPEARAIQKQYYRDYGTTLNGLMQSHGVDPEDYLRFVHDIDLSPLERSEALGAGLARLTGRRYVFTNGCRRHANRVLDRLGLAQHFDDIWDIRTTGFCPKPNPAAYDTILSRANAPARNAAMFDDVARNLVPAHALGMTTVWLRNGSDWSKQGPGFPVASATALDHETDDLAFFLANIRI